MTASMSRGVEWIALNDEPTDLDPESIQHYVSTMLLADLFDKMPLTVAKKIATYRAEHPEHSKGHEYVA
jgi:hypothetical protein